MVSLTHHEIGDLQLSRLRGRRHHHMGEKGPIDKIHLVVNGEFLHDLRPSHRIRAIVLGNKKKPKAQKEFLKNYTQRAVMVFSSMNILMEAILDFAVPTNDSLLDPRGKKA